MLYSAGLCGWWYVSMSMTKCDILGHFESIDRTAQPPHRLYPDSCTLLLTSIISHVPLQNGYNPDSVVVRSHSLYAASIAADEPKKT